MFFHSPKKKIPNSSTKIVIAETTKYPADLKAIQWYCDVNCNYQLKTTARYCYRHVLIIGISADWSTCDFSMWKGSYFLQLHCGDGGGTWPTILQLQLRCFE